MERSSRNFQPSSSNRKIQAIFASPNRYFVGCPCSLPSFSNSNCKSLVFYFLELQGTLFLIIVAVHSQHQSIVVIFAKSVNPTLQLCLVQCWIIFFNSNVKILMFFSQELQETLFLFIVAVHSQPKTEIMMARQATVLLPIKEPGGIAVVIPPI